MLYGSKLSLFTAKLEAALQFYGAQYEFKQKRGEEGRQIEARAGTHQVPVLLTPENWAIADTTPIIEMLDGRFPARRLFPEGPLGILAHVVEEFLDEWVARTMVHYRWHYPESAAFAADILGGGDAQAAERVRGWGPRACRATGTETEFHQRAAEAEYVRILEATERQLAVTPYLLGARPSVVDCMVLGGLRAHTLHDPDPRKVVQSYERVVAWAKNATLDWDGGGAWAPFPQSTPFARTILDEAKTSYAPFVKANAAALRQGAKAFVIDTYGQPASYLARPYPEFSRGLIRARIERLSETDRRATLAWLEGSGLAEAIGG